MVVNMSEIKDIFGDNSKFDAQQAIVSQLLDDSNLETKTELEKPLRFSCLTIFQEVLKDNELTYSSKIIEMFIIKSCKFLISHNREGRKEIISALQAFNQQQMMIDKTNPLNPFKQIQK